ncbi:MAG: hypothetical protein MZV63_29560 [Marinilabiliales bacterium]|nr:hypothetical protein [Marinilabiliales bacterium]
MINKPVIRKKYDEVFIKTDLWINHFNPSIEIISPGATGLPFLVAAPVTIRFHNQFFIRNPEDIL